MMDPGIEQLLGTVDGSKFLLVTVAAMRGREVNSYFNRLSDGLGSIVPPQVSSVARKPLSIALEEVAAGKIISVPLIHEDPELAVVEAADGTIVTDATLDDEEAAAAVSQETPADA